MLSKKRKKGARGARFKTGLCRSNSLLTRTDVDTTDSLPWGHQHIWAPCFNFVVTFIVMFILNFISNLWNIDMVTIKNIHILIHFATSRIIIISFVHIDNVWTWYNHISMMVKNVIARMHNWKFCWEIFLIPEIDMYLKIACLYFSSFLTIFRVTWSLQIGSLKNYITRASAAALPRCMSQLWAIR